MGCVSSKANLVEKPNSPLQDVPIEEDPVREPQEEEATEEDENGKGSDFVDFLDINFEDAKEELIIVAVPDDEDYQLRLPPNPHVNNNIQLCTVPFFNDWTAIPKATPNDEHRPVSTTTPLKQSPQRTVRVITIKEVDERARQCPRECSQSFEKLNQYLLINLHDQEECEKLTVRALIVWLSNQDIESFINVPASEETPEGFLSLIAQKRTMYSTFFTVLCREANVLCVRVRGISKAGRYEPGDTNLSEDNWTAVYLKEKWELIHPFWVCRSLIGQSAGGWIKLEEMGKYHGKRTISTEGTLVNAFKEYYFLPNPYEFMFYTYPDDSKWQLTESILSREEFILMPHVLPTFFGLGLKLLSEQKCSLNAVNGENEITMQAQMKNANTVELHYELYLREPSPDSRDFQEMLSASNIPRLVAMIRCGDIWRFKTQFPVEGTYKLCIYGGPYKEPLSRVADFRIDCNKRKKDCIPLPLDPGRIGFGPGPKAEEVGLFIPSHMNGLVPASLKNNIDITFQVDTLFVKQRSVRVELTNNKATTSIEERTILAKQVTIKIDNQEIRISTCLQQEGEYVLTIFSGAAPHGSHKDQVTETNIEDMENVCNYLLSTKVRERETANKKNARRALKSAVSVEIPHGVDLQPRIDEIEDSLAKCIRQNIRDDDPEILAAKNKAGFLKIKKDVRDAVLRRNVDVTTQTIKRIQTSEYRRVCNHDVERLEHFKKFLDTLGRYHQEVPKVEQCVSQLAHVLSVRPEVEATVMALLILLGENQEKFEDWEDMRQTLLPPIESNIRTGVLHKMHSVAEKEIGKDVLLKAQSHLQKYTVDEVEHANMAAAEVYKWTKGILTTYLGQN